MAELFSREEFHCNVVGEVDGHVDDEEVQQVVGGRDILPGGVPGKEGAEANVDAEGRKDEHKERPDFVTFPLKHFFYGFHRFFRQQHVNPYEEMSFETFALASTA